MGYFVYKFKLSLTLFALIMIGGTILSVSWTEAFASSTDGTIDSTYKYAWNENAGWIDFGVAEGNVHISDSALTGYAFGESVGWISLNCSNNSSCSTADYKVQNDGAGNLSGYAWNENTGWINFNPSSGGVSINSSGEFLGNAWSENIGWIVFNCATTSSCGTVDYKVKTDWRVQGARPACNNATDDDSDGGTDYPSDTGCSSLEDDNETNPGGSGGGTGYVRQSGTATQGSQSSVPLTETKAQQNPFLETQTALVTQAVESVTKAVKAIIPNFLKSKLDKEESPKAIEEGLTEEDTPLALNGKWNILSQSSINDFIFSPLPDRILDLAKKFPDLQKTFDKVGVKKMSDLSKLKNVNFSLSGLNSRVGISDGAGIPVSSLSSAQKDILPSEIIFAKSGSLIDYGISLSITDDGNPEQRINAVVGTHLDLAIKIDEPVNNIKGYLVVKNLERQVARKSVPSDSLLAASIINALEVNHPKGEKVEIEQRLVLDEFEYEDIDKDGIYTAQITSPLVHGEYEIISIIEYKNISLGKKELRLVAVIDPEGYVYKKNGNEETRASNAKVSLLWKNTKSGNFELWPAKQYQQTNPQKTDKSGTYTFLVPQGVYKLTVSSDGYHDFEGEEFAVEDGIGVHENIEIKPKSWWRGLFGLFK